MAYICKNPASYKGEVVGTGQCVAFVQRAAKAPLTSNWKEGVKVKGSTTMEKGTAIATFKNGVYPNNSTGNHAAIYISQNDTGILVYDQWFGHPVDQRLIKFRGGSGSPSNDGDAFSVIE
jgi:hypothetical protein